MYLYTTSPKPVMTVILIEIKEINTGQPDTRNLVEENRMFYTQQVLLRR